MVKIEPPAGERNRHVGPFLDDVPHPARSLSFWYYNTSKRGITLDLQTADGRALFGRLAATSDIILETLRPGFLASLGLDYASLREPNPGLIMCSLTPFGQTGPWRALPNRRDSAIATVSAERAAYKPLSPGLPKLPGSFGPATHGLRTSTKNESSLAAGCGAVKQSAPAMRQDANLFGITTVSTTCLTYLATVAFRRKACMMVAHDFFVRLRR